MNIGICLLPRKVAVLINQYNQNSLNPFNTATHSVLARTLRRRGRRRKRTEGDDGELE
jgi:hypothetical protein